MTIVQQKSGKKLITKFNLPLNYRNRHRTCLLRVKNEREIQIKRNYLKIHLKKRERRNRKVRY